MRYIIIELKWAIIFTVSMLVWMLLEHTMGWHDAYIAEHWWLTLLFIPVAFLLYYLALKEKRRRFYNGKITWFQAFLSGCLLGLFVALLSPLAQYINHEYIAPSYFPNIIAYSVDNSLLTREEAVANFNLKSYMLQSAVGAIVAGIITSAIVALLVKRK